MQRIACMQLLFAGWITAICFSETFHFSVLCMHDSALVVAEIEIIWDSVLFLLNIIINESQNGENICI
jgi:hypothetical protein